MGDQVQLTPRRHNEAVWRRQRLTGFIAKILLVVVCVLAIAIYIVVVVLVTSPRYGEGGLSLMPGAWS